MRLLKFCFLLVLLVAPVVAEPARILFLGEEHTAVADHEGQLSVLRSLEGERVVVAAEMFTVRADRFLDDWNRGEALLTEDLWTREWGHPLDLYVDIWEWTRGRAVLASLRPDPALTARVKSEGVCAALEMVEEVLVGPASYREALRGIFAAHLPPDRALTDEMLNSYFLIQCFWDEYMAWRIARLADLYPDHRIAVLVGYGHLHPENGIPARLKRRRPDLRAINIAFSEERRELCDVLWAE